MIREEIELQLFLNFLLLVVGFVGLIKGADWFVDGSAEVARKLHVSSVIIGLTIVAMGTSAPELAVSTTAALKGSNEIAFSNVVGSNIFNLMVVLGVCAVIHAVPVDSIIIKRDFPFSIGAMILTFIATGLGAVLSGKLFESSAAGRLGLDMSENIGKVTRPLSISFLVIFVAYIGLLIYDAKKHPTPEDESDDMTPGKCLLLIVVGVALIVGGGQAVVYSSQFIARSFGMTETLIGLTVVALGTSLPELVTSIVAARKGETSLAIGNVVGSNIFNNLFILGVSSTIHPIAVNRASIFDMVVLILMSILILLFVFRKKKLGRAGGLLMLAIYAAYIVFAAIR
ncbi:MAG: calcium/sodium antiporter [Eubacterium sp.]|nr:calcium/sodium antiporter [Eubacterium sp.]